MVNISVSQRFAARKMIVRRKARFFAVRKEIYNRYKEKQQTEQQAASVALKRVMSECERESEVIEIDNDITAPTDRRHRQRHHRHVEFEPALQALRVSDGMKGGTPDILYDL